ncbi:MAG: histone deacetylase [Deltaproteobacteria bacterium]|nr:histone deacetylase [Deltaproteobacteria bacterium]
MKRGFLYDPMFLEHECDTAHPERPERLGAVLRGLEDAGVWNGARMIPARPVTTEELTRVHDETYVAAVLRELARGSGYLDGDTFFSRGSRDAALNAAGGTVDLVFAVHDRDVEWGFAAVRPPGHHASRSRAGGFCIFNNIAVAASALRASGRAERVLIFDWDVHHGNGTQDQFWDEPDVLFISVHQWPHYPGSGLTDQIGGRRALGRTVNFPFPSGGRDKDYLSILDEVVAPLAHAFKPDHVLVSAGFDAHNRDPLAGMQLTSDGYGLMAARLKSIADACCQGRLTFVLEGGYDLDALEESVRAVALGIERGRADSEESDDSRPASALHGRVIAETILKIRPHWPGVF